MNLTWLTLMTMLSTSAPCGDRQNLPQLLPDAPSGWQIQRNDIVHTPETLYEYIDGGAELYLSYDMKEAVSRIIEKDGTEIRIEIFDMLEPRNAFGVFSHTRTADEAEYGQGSQYFPGAQIFWKGKYFISITANDDDRSIREVIRQLSSQVDGNIKSEGPKPVIVTLLPSAGLQPDAYIYFHHYIWLNSYYFIADDNFLFIDRDVDALLAKYKDGGGNPMYLALIRYDDEAKAATAYDSFRKQYLKNEPDCARIEDGAWVSGVQYGAFLVCIFNGSSKKALQRLSAKVYDNIKKKAS